MESESRYAIVGVFVLTVITAAIVFVIWLGQISFDKEYSDYQVVFKGPVHGLSQSGEVRFNGIKVGEVTKLGLDPDDPNMVLAQIRIFAETPVKKDSYAQLEPQGITGLSYIQIYGGTHSSEKLSRDPGNLFARIPSKTAQLEGLVAGGEDVLLSANTALVRVNAVLSTANIDEFTKILANVRVISEQLAAEKDLVANLNEALIAASNAAKEMQIAAEAITEFSLAGTKLVEGDTTIMIAQIDAAAEELEQVSKQASQLLLGISDPLQQFSNEGLTELVMAITDLRAMLQATTRVIEEVDRNPSEFIAGEPITEIEVPR
ncbi:MAG: MlaD family protein [Robiginitomaculum sp.]|nr:MlaD family protein [Robiginitomaculum sp.]